MRLTEGKKEAIIGKVLFRCDFGNRMVKIIEKQKKVAVKIYNHIYNKRDRDYMANRPDWHKVASGIKIRVRYGNNSETCKFIEFPVQQRIPGHRDRYSIHASLDDSTSCVKQWLELEQEHQHIR